MLAGPTPGPVTVDGLATPLHDVTFCVVDVETTGGSPASCALTEIGAARYRAGECLGTFQTLVNPGVPIPPPITVLTGITEAMILPAPSVAEVLPALLEFVGGAVLVGHNLRFDVAFLDAALAAHHRPPLGHHRVDTVALARALVRDEVPDCRLATLAEILGLDRRPTHRALDDALATADLLHWLLERAGTFGATGLDDLLALPRLVAHRQAAKLRLTVRLPRGPGAYVLRDRQGRPLHVGAARDVRRRVRAYFSGVTRVVGIPGHPPCRTAPLLRELHRVEAVPCATPLEAVVRALRLAHALEPRHDRPRGRSGAHRYVRVIDGRLPRLAVTRTPRRSARSPVPLHLGPFPSAAEARRVAEAVEVAACLAGGDRAETLGRGLGGEPHLLLDALAGHAGALATSGDDEGAATGRDQADLLAAALRRQRRRDTLRRAERIVVEEPGGSGAELRRGRLVRAWAPAGGGGSGGRPAAPGATGTPGPATIEAAEPTPAEGPLPPALADELDCVGAWLDRHAHRIRLRHVDGELSSPLPARAPTPTAAADVAAADVA